MSRSSAPAKLRRNVAQDRIEDVGAVVDTKLIGDSQQQGVGGGDRLILGQLLDERLGFPGISFAEARYTAVDEPNLVLRVALAAEIRAVEVIDDGENAAADRDTRFAGVAGLGPRLAESFDLLGL